MGATECRSHERSSNAVDLSVGVMQSVLVLRRAFDRNQLPRERAPRAIVYGLPRSIRREVLIDVSAETLWSAVRDDETASGTLEHSHQEPSHV